MHSEMLVLAALFILIFYSNNTGAAQSGVIAENEMVSVRGTAWIGGRRFWNCKLHNNNPDWYKKTKDLDH